MIDIAMAVYVYQMGAITVIDEAWVTAHGLKRANRGVYATGNALQSTVEELSRTFRVHQGYLTSDE